MALFKVEFERGVMLVDAMDADFAEEWACAEFGRSSGPYEATEATESDIAHIKGFGGIVHKAK